MQTTGFFISAFLGAWLLIVSVLLLRFLVLFSRLTKGVEQSDLKKVLEKILIKEEQNEIEIGRLAKRINWLEEDGKEHIQKVGLVRFNPFKELGGDHSFSLAILDAGGSGIVITSLHTRDRTRMYMKEIKKGKAGAELSSDERKALAIALK